MRSFPILVAALLLAAPLRAAAVVGQPAPAISLADAGGRAVALADYRGKAVVLEWTSAGCPFVDKQYSGGTMQALQAEAKAKGVVWLTINSNAAGKAGYQSAADATTALRAAGATPTAFLPDPNGVAGRAYGVRTAPQLFVVAKDGTLAYAGAVDDLPSADPADIARAKPLLKDAIAAVADGQKPDVTSSRPYGCLVRY